MKKLRLFGRGKNSQSMPTEETTPAVKPKVAYTDRFLKRREFKTRQCVYISHDVHGIVSRLVRQLANQGQQITVGGYIDTVLSEHLQANKEEINEVFRRDSGNLL